MILLLSSNFRGIDNFQAKWQSMSIFAKCGERTLSWDIIIIEIGNDNISHQSPNIWRCIASLVWRESTSPKMVNPLRHSIRSILWKLLEIWKNLERIIYIGIPEKTGFKVVKLREDFQMKRDELGLFAEAPLHWGLHQDLAITGSLLGASSLDPNPTDTHGPKMSKNGLKNGQNRPKLNPNMSKKCGRHPEDTVWYLLPSKGCQKVIK